MPVSGWVTARTVGTGDWDLALFDARTGRLVGGSSGFGGREVVQGLAVEGSTLFVQACRRSGSGRKAKLTLEAAAIDTSRKVRPQLARIAVPNRARLRELQSLGLDLTEHGGPGFREAVLYGDRDALKLRDARFTYTLAVRDLVAKGVRERRADAAYAARVRASALPSGRTTYRRLFDYTNELKRIAADHPNLVKPITLPLKTYEGREVQGIEITTNPHARDGKPVFLQMGLHHAREWPSGEHAMEWAYELIKGYLTGNPRARSLVERTRTIVVPIVNPDGFNQSREAGELYGRGGGADDDFNDNGTSTDAEFILASSAHPNEYKRKNCRFPSGNGGSCTQPDSGIVGPGVDPNRNYGGFWGGPGASTDFDAQDYRGPGPFSEPETENVRRLVATRQVTMLITNHTYTNLVLRPPGVQTQGTTPDEPMYKGLGDAMASKNGYSSQYGYQLYDTTGTTEDWSYWTTGGLGYTFEIGDLGFHPPFAETVAEYEGTTDDAQNRGGNREAYFLAQEATADPSKHSVIAGTAPTGLMLRARKTFQTPTSQTNPDGSPRTFEDTLETVLDISPRNGAFEWHVNPSTRPLVVRGQSRPATGQPSPPASFSGGPSTNSHPCADFDTEDEACWNDHQFTVPQGPGIDNGKATVRLDWTTPASDWDMKIYLDSNGDGSSVGEGEPVATSGLGATNSDSRHEEATFTPQPGATYVVRVINWAAVDSYNGKITYGPPDPYVPPRIESWGLTCETASATVLSRHTVVVSRGERARVNLAACAAALRRAFRSGRGCDRPTRRVRGTTLDRVKLGSNRTRNLRRYRIGRRGRRSIDKFCLREGRRGRSIRVAYPSKRLRKGLGRRGLRRYKTTKAVLILTNSRRFKIKGVRVGTRVRGKVARRFRKLRSYRVGKNRWYVRKGSAARILYKVRGRGKRRRVLEIGIADRSLNSTKRKQRRFVNAWRR